MTAVSFGTASFHGAPPRSPFARAVGLARFAVTRAKFKGGDLNESADAVAKILRRRVVGSGVLWLTVPRYGWRVVRVQAYDVGGDHAAPLVTMVHLRSSTVVRFLVINCMGYSASDVKSAAILRAGMRLEPDVIIASECVKIRARSAGQRSALYAWHQPGTVGSSESGAIIGALKSSTRMTQRSVSVGSDPTREGGGIDRRSITRARITMRVPS